MTHHSNEAWRCNQCGLEAPGSACYIDLSGSMTLNATSDHYSLQWGESLKFYEFISRNAAAKSAMASASFDWAALFRNIKERAKAAATYVYDAACGYGGIAGELIDIASRQNLIYVGADIHESLITIPGKIEGFADAGFLLRWDISEPLPIAESFDYVICRNAVHHTPDPEKTFASLCAVLKPGGTIAISIYRKKAICREVSDDVLRDVIMQMPPAQAFEACREFTVLGKALQQIRQTVHIPEDLPLLGIKKGNSDIQEFIYYNFLKCFYNSDFGEHYSTLVNFDWYHPPFAFRYTPEEVKAWFLTNGVEIVAFDTSEAQHFAVGVKATSPAHVSEAQKR